MLKGKKLVRYVSLLIDLLDRKETYESVIIEKQDLVNELGIENKAEMPDYPEIQYKFSLKKFILKLWLFPAVSMIPFAILDEIFNLSHNGNKLFFYLSFLTTVFVIGFIIYQEILNKRKAKNFADTIYYDAVGEVLEHNRLDDLRVWKENKQAIEIKREIEQWQKKYDFVNETILKACQYGDLPEEYHEIEILTIFLEYLKDKRCDTIYECMLKYDEAKRMQDISDNIDALEYQIEEFEEAFSEASRKVSVYLRKRKEAVENLCRQQARALDDIEYNQETTNQSLMLLSLFD